VRVNVVNVRDNEARGRGSPVRLNLSKVLKVVNFSFFRLNLPETPLFTVLARKRRLGGYSPGVGGGGRVNVRVAPSRVNKPEINV